MNREFLRVGVITRVPEFECIVAGIHLDRLKDKPVVGIVGLVVVVAQISDTGACH